MGTMTGEEEDVSNAVCAGDSVKGPSEDESSPSPSPPT